LVGLQQFASSKHSYCSDCVTAADVLQQQSQSRKQFDCSGSLAAVTCLQRP
jgi:hypothetical protein